MLTTGEKKKEIVACIITGNLIKSKMYQPEEIRLWTDRRYS